MPIAEHRARRWRMARQTFRSVLEGKDFVYAPGAWDALSALMIQKAGFEAICASGYAIAGGLGMPDAEIYTMSELLECVKRIASKSDVPIIADIDTGFGNAVNVMRTVREFEAAGAGAMFMEDQASPKRCPILNSAPPPLISVEEAVGKIKAALDARQSEDTVIVARTDGRGEEGLERTVAYAEAGADMILPTTKTFTTVAEFKRCHEATGKPLVLSLTPGTTVGRQFTPEALREIGCKIGMLPFQVLYAAVTGMRTTLREMRENANAPASGGTQITNVEFSELIGFHEVEELMEKYLPAALPEAAAVGGA